MAVTNDADKYLGRKKKIEISDINISNSMFDNIGSSSLKIIGEIDIYNSKDKLIMYGFTEGIYENIHELINKLIIFCI